MAKTKAAPIKKPTPAVESRREERERSVVVKTPAKTLGNTIVTYKVRSGDTASSLARRSGISVGELADMNGLDRLDLHEGQKLVLPAGSVAAPREQADTVDLTPPARRPASEDNPSRRSAPPVNPPATQGTYHHVVKNGETFSSIARERGVSVAALTKANKNVDPARLSINQRLNVPGLQVASRDSGDRVIDGGPPAHPTAYRPDTLESEAEPENEEAANAPSVSYHVTTDDSQESLVRKFNTTPSELRELNQMSAFDQFSPGTYIKVPWRSRSTRN